MTTFLFVRPCSFRRRQRSVENAEVGTAAPRSKAAVWFGEGGRRRKVRSLSNLVGFRHGPPCIPLQKGMFLGPFIEPITS